jgi:predicted amidohydrolase
MRVAVAQFAPELGRVEANLDTIRSAVAEADSAGADLFVAPEMSLTGWTLRDEATRVRLARDVEDMAIPSLARDAIERNVAIVVGGPIHANPASPRSDRRPALANAVILLGPDGSRTDYAKIHLFGEERMWWMSGRDPVVWPGAAATIGLTIGYDGEFPEVPRMLRLAGAELIIIPTTNMTPYERDQDILFAARALENECPVIVANRIGHENEWTYFGRSLVTDQRGRIVAQAGGGEELLIADITPAEPGDPALSYMSQRRPEVYGRIVDPMLTRSGTRGQGT